MNKYLLIILIPFFALFGNVAFPEKLLEKYYEDASVELTEQEKAAIAITNKWKANSANAIKPVPGPDGSIQFLFGANQPNIVCAVLQVCDVELEPGEQVNTMHLGDSARWLVEPAITGVGSSEIQHLIIKPMDVGLETSLVVTSNRRTYHMRLKSHSTQFMARVSFVYPENALAKWEMIKNKESKHLKESILPNTNESLKDLDFGYTIKGNASWKPVRVYNNGMKTIIQMPKSMLQTEAPTLLVVRSSGRFLSKDEHNMINYRIQDDRYIVDNLFDKAIMIIGVGSNQKKIIITREAKL